MENNVNEIPIDLGSLRSKVLTLQDVYDYCLSQRKFLIILTLGIYFPVCKGFTVEFFYQVIAGVKKVRINNNYLLVTFIE